MTKWFLRLTLLLALCGGFVVVCGCEQSSTQPAAQPAGKAQSLPTVIMTLGEKTFTIEKATDDGTREIGLMYRDSMPADHGMIFAFPDEDLRSFWMKNTRIPLDIVYTDKDGKIVSILGMKPFDLSSVPSGKPAKYAIELNLNVAAAAGLHVGDIIKIPPEVTAAAR